MYVVKLNYINVLYYNIYRCNIKVDFNILADSGHLNIYYNAKLTH